MAFDFSHIDAELDALGLAQANVDELARREADSLGTRAEVDAALEALATAQPFHFEPPQIALPRRSDPKSGEISLGEPVRRSSHPASGELNLDGEEPTSGSFELDEPQPVAEAPVPASSATEAEILVLSVPPSLRSAASPGPEPLALFADNDGDLDGEIPAMGLATKEDGESPTAPPAEEVDPFASVVDEVSDLEADAGLFSTRDPDAEFDALFDEATSPSGVPTRGFEEESANPDALLAGLKAPPLRDPVFTAVGQNEAAAAMSELFEMEEGDATEILDARSVFSGSSTVSDPFPADEELGSSEFEIVLDEAGEAKDLVPSDRPPPPGKAPSQTTTPSSDKRPSFLGRLFGKKDE